MGQIIFDIIIIILWTICAVLNFMAGNVLAILNIFFVLFTGLYV